MRHHSSTRAEHPRAERLRSRIRPATWTVASRRRAKAGENPYEHVTVTQAIIAKDFGGEVLPDGYVRIPWRF